MPDEVLKVSRRYLLLFWGYRENTGGGIFTPSPSAARVNKGIWRGDTGTVEQAQCEHAMPYDRSAHAAPPAAEPHQGRVSHHNVNKAGRVIS